MKFLITLFTVFIISEDCTKTKKPQTIENLKISYQAISRGFFKQLSFENAQMMYSEDPNLKMINTFKISNQEWTEVLELSSQLDFEDLENLIAPTDKRLYDGAAHATIIVDVGGKLYISSTFDEGHPPGEIETLVNKMLTISEKYLQP